MIFTTSAQSNFSNLWIHITLRRRTQIFLLVLLMFITSIAEVVSIGAVIPFLSVIVDPQNFFNSKIATPIIIFFKISEPSGLIIPFTIVFALAAFISGVLRITLLWAQLRVGHAIGADLSFKIFHSTLHQTYTTHLSLNSSEMIAAITEKTNAVVRSVILPLLMLVSSFLILLTILVGLITYSPFISLSSFFGFGIIYTFIILFNRRRLLKNSHIINNLISKRIKALQEGLGGIRDVILDNTQSAFSRIYRNADLPLRRAQASNAFLSGSPRYAIEALGLVILAGLTYILSKNGNNIVNAIPILGVFALGAQRILPLLQQAYSSWSTINGAEAILKDVIKLLNQPLPISTYQKKSLPLSFKQMIDFNNISFRYSPEMPWVLKNLNFQIKKGDRVGLIGETGSGKSTMVDVLMGLLEASEGELKIDNIKIEHKKYLSWRTNIAHVPQTIFLADASITENIAFGVPFNQIDHDRVRKAAKMAQISETINNWKEKYEMTIGERGVRLSGGQRQRIGIARALYKQANMIVFDEATSSLDNKTERAVMETIYNLGREITIFIIAHRLTSLSGCDVVMELEYGKLKRKGKYKDIID
jgi:ATP-binding cassette, subfamily B, bacterial PglK